MPKGKYDPDDPMELVGVAIPASPDALDEMARVFADEFLRIGYSPDQVFGLFKDPFYRAPNQIYVARGEQFVRGIIDDLARPGPPAERANRPDAPGAKGDVAP